MSSSVGASKRIRLGACRMYLVSCVCCFFASASAAASPQA